MQVSKVKCLRRNNYRITQKQKTAPASQKQEHIYTQDPYNWSNKNLYNLRSILLKRAQNKVQSFFYTSFVRKYTQHVGVSFGEISYWFFFRYNNPKGILDQNPLFHPKELGGVSLLASLPNIFPTDLNLWLFCSNLSTKLLHQPSVLLHCLEEKLNS